MSVPALRLSAVLFVLLAACGAESPDSLVAAAKEDLAKQERMSAIVRLKSALEQDPQSGEARVLLGKVLADTGGSAAAEVELRKALELGRPAEEVLPELARALLRQRALQKLVDELGAKSLANAPSQADLKTTVATAWMLLGRGSEAEAALSAALLAQPDHAAAQLLQIRMLAAGRDPAKAGDLLAKLLQRHPDLADGWKLDGDLRRQRNDEDGALASYRKAIGLDRGSLEAHADAIAILLNRSDLDALGKQIEQLRSVAPSHPQTLYFQARLAFQRQDYKAAQSVLQQLLRLNPEHAAGLSLAGATELQLGGVAQAQAHLAKAVRLTPHLRITRRLLAEAYLRGGRPDQALLALQPALGPTADATTLALAAQANLLGGQTKRAEELYAAAAKLDPRDDGSRTALALAALRRGKLDEGMRDLEAAVASDTRGRAADMALVAAHLARGQADAALKAIDAMERKVQNKAVTANLRGRAQLLLRDSRGARESFERALSVDRSYFPATASLAALDMLDKKPDAARKRFEDVLAAEPRHALAMLALADLKAREGAGYDETKKLIEDAVQASPDDPTARIKFVQFQLQARRPAQALLTAQSADKAFPERVEVLEVLGRAQLAAGDNNQAATTFTRLVSMRPDAAAFYLGLGEASWGLRKADAAREHLKKAIALQPDLIRAQELLAIVEIRSNRFNEALLIARQLQKQRPRDAIGFALEGDVESFRRKPDAAVAAYRVAVRKPVVAPQAAVSLHTLLLGTNKANEAAQFAGEWLKARPRDAMFLYHLGDAALRQGRLAEAESRYQQVIGIEPFNYLALNNLAWALVQQNKKGGVAYAEKALEFRRDDAALMDTLASALAVEGDLDKAIEVQSKAVQLQANAPMLRLNLARLYVKANRKPDAETELDALDRLGDKFPGRAEVLRLRTALKGS